MPDLLTLQFGIMGLISFALFIVKCVAIVDCVTRDESKFQAVGTLPKRTWLLLLSLGLITHIWWPSYWDPIGLFSLAGTVAALVYLAQVRSSN